MIRPDVVLVAGDLVDDGSAHDTHARMSALHAILEKLECPWIAIPGNHDGDVDAFYRVFSRPRDVEDIHGLRFLAFLDKPEPGYNASRSAADIDRIRTARRGYDGPIVVLQHVPLAPSGLSESPFNYTNADEIIEAMTRAGVVLSVSGHYHAGTAPLRRGEGTLVTAPALCEPPFGFLLIEVRNGCVSVQRRRLAMPRELALVDNHVHTQLAYCGENMTVERAIELGEVFGLAGLSFAEHSGQLYYDSDDYWGGVCFRDGLDGVDASASRTDTYWTYKRDFARAGVRFGLEADCDRHGRVVLAEEDRRQCDLILGSVHATSSAKDPQAGPETVKREFMHQSERLLAGGIHVLAHPFRIFTRTKWPVPEDLFGPLARLLKKYGVAAEINFHSQSANVGFVAACLEEGVRFSLGGDAHNLYEVGELTPHLRILERAGHQGDLSEVVLA